jgi:hypothetical protein
MSAIQLMVRRAIKHSILRSYLLTYLLMYMGHGLFFTRLDCQSNAKPSEKDYDLPGIRTRDLWISSQHC